VKRVMSLPGASCSTWSQSQAQATSEGVRIAQPGQEITGPDELNVLRDRHIAGPEVVMRVSLEHGRR
jgi:hypothetical protein